MPGAGKVLLRSQLEPRPGFSFPSPHLSALKPTQSNSRALCGEARSPGAEHCAGSPQLWLTRWVTLGWPSPFSGTVSPAMNVAIGWHSL